MVGMYNSSIQPPEEQLLPPLERYGKKIIYAPSSFLFINFISKWSLF
jgi:hypothetical protein